MKNIFVDANGRAIQVAPLSIGKDFTTSGDIDEIEGGQYIRVKAITDSYISLSNHAGDGVLLSAGETEYFYIQKDAKFNLKSGSINVMY